MKCGPLPLEYVVYILCYTASLAALIGSLRIDFSHLDLHSCSVKTLYLHMNKIGDTGAEKLAAALPSLPNLNDARLDSRVCVLWGQQGIYPPTLINHI